MRLGDAVRIVNREAKNIEKAKTEIKKYLKTGEFSEMTIEEGRILDRINGKYGLSSFIEHNLRARPCKKYLKPQIESSVGFNGKDWSGKIVLRIAVMANLGHLTSFSPVRPASIKKKQEHLKNL